MNPKMDNGEVFIWMQLLGFERKDKDRGVSRLIEKMHFKPHGIGALLYHPDIVNQHKGMEEEYILPPDNCSYRGIPRNEERERQNWTNYDLRILMENLNEIGVESYLSIMGTDLHDAHHKEWISDHPELRYASKEGYNGYNVLKRFADGTYYEDFFVEKLCQTLIDYHFTGVQLADDFCPTDGMLHCGDFSADMLEQFSSYTGIEFPENINSSLCNDGSGQRALRGEWIWKSYREEWIGFNAWRWERFFRKICCRLHAIGKKVIVLGMYCTDPFETLYCKGIDLKRIVDAGVDYLMPNILPTSVHMQEPNRPYYFHRYMAITPLTAAFIPDAKLLCMLGVKDATEEWDILNHAPGRLERDLYTVLSYQLNTGKGYRRCSEGLMICLGDGIKSDDWQWLKDRFNIAFLHNVKRVLTPTVLWSDAANSNMLHAYIHSRRWTTHKFMYEISRRGTPCSAVIRSDNIADAEGILFVPNFDLLSDSEKMAVASYNKGPVICTVPKGFHPAEYDITPEISFTDRYSDYPMTMFAFNACISGEVKKGIEELLSQDDGTPDLQGNPAEAEENIGTLDDELTFCKVTNGFCDACALLVRKASEEMNLFKCNKPFVAMMLNNGRFRLYIYNPSENNYEYAVVESKNTILDATIISKYPVLPVRYIKQAIPGYTAVNDDNEHHRFQTRLMPSGVTIVEISIAERI
jgi:hypothetical protein